MNDLLSQVERAFLLPDGLPDRPWFKHSIYAPGLTTGYAAWPLPAIHQAIEEKTEERLGNSVSTTVERINRAAQGMKSAREHAQAVLGMR